MFHPYSCAPSDQPALWAAENEQNPVHIFTIQYRTNHPYVGIPYIHRDSISRVLLLSGTVDNEVWSYDRFCFAVHGKFANEACGNPCETRNSRVSAGERPYFMGTETSFCNMNVQHMLPAGCNAIRSESVYDLQYSIWTCYS